MSFPRLENILYCLSFFILLLSILKILNFFLCKIFTKDKKVHTPLDLFPKLILSAKVTWIEKNQR